MFLIRSANGLFLGYLTDLLIPNQPMETKIHHIIGLIVLWNFMRIIDTKKYNNVRLPAKYMLYLEITNIFNNSRILANKLQLKQKNITNILFALTFLTIRPYCFYNIELLNNNKKLKIPSHFKYMIRGLISLNAYWAFLIFKILVNAKKVK